MPSITNTNNPVSLSAITANSTTERPQGENNFLQVKEIMVEGGWSSKPFICNF